MDKAYQQKYKSDLSMYSARGGVHIAPYPMRCGHDSTYQHQRKEYAQPSVKPGYRHLSRTSWATSTPVQGYVPQQESDIKASKGNVAPHPQPFSPRISLKLYPRNKHNQCKRKQCHVAYAQFRYLFHNIYSLHRDYFKPSIIPLLGSWSGTSGKPGSQSGPLLPKSRLTLNLTTA